MSKKLEMNKKRLIAIVFTIFMLASGFGALANWHLPSVPNVEHHNSKTSQPSLSNISTSNDVSIGVNYWTEHSVANSSTTTVPLPVVENSSYTDEVYSPSPTLSNEFWSKVSPQKFVKTISFPSLYFYTGSNSPTVQLDDMETGLDHVNTTGGVFITALTTLYANLSLDGQTYSWMWSPDFTGNNSPSWEAYFNPAWDINAGTPTDEWVGTSSIQFTYLILGVTIIQGGDYGPLFLDTTPSYQGQDVIEDVGSSSSGAVPYEIGYHFNPTSTSFTIPQYEHDYSITWTSTVPVTVTYDSLSETGTSDYYTGLLNYNSFTISPDGDPAVEGISAITFAYNLTGQYQVSSTSTTEPVSESFTYSQVSGTANEASASFSFSGTTPSSAVVIDYETSANSLKTATTTVVFTPTISLYNPYYTYQQNELVATLSGASTGTSSTSGIEYPSFTGNSVTYTSYDNSPSWTVSLSLYGNIMPTYVSHKAVFSGSSSTVDLYFNMSQPVFSGEELGIYVEWGDGTQNTYTSTSDYNFFEQHTYNQTGTYTIQVYGFNIPDPTNDYLANLINSTISTTYPVSISVTTNPLPNSVLQSGEGITITFVSTDNLVSALEVNETYDGLTSVVSNTGFGTPSAGTSITVYPSYAGTNNFVLTLTFDGARAVYSYDFYAPLYPSNTSTYLTVIYSNTAVNSYPITLSGVPSGTGYYQQFITISNPSSYGINSDGSNLQFTTSNGTYLYAWIQNISSSSLQVWIKNPYGNSVIDMNVISPSSENLFSPTGYLGEAPQLSPTYGEYDNGKYVFNFYDNFSGTTFDTSVWSDINTGTITQDNGITLSLAASEDVNVYTTSTFSYPLIVEGMYKVDTTGGTPSYYGPGETTSTSNSGTFLGAGMDSGYYFGINPDDATSGLVVINSTGNDTTLASYSQHLPDVLGEGWINTGSEYIYVNGTAVASSTNTTNTIGDYHLYLGGMGTGGSGAGSIFIQYYFARTLPSNGMPTFTIGSGSNLIADSPQINYVHYSSASAYEYNKSLWQYTYDIPNNNSRYVTLYYAPGWSFMYGDPTQYTQYPSSDSITFVGVQTWTILEATFLEPVEIANPLGELTINYVPSTALAEVAGVKIPFSELTTYVNGQELTSDNYQYVIGQPLTIKTVDIFNQTIASENITPTTTTDALQIPIAFSQLQFANLNSTYYVDIYVKQNGIEEALTSVLPLQTVTIYIPNGKYNFSFQYFAIDNNVIIPSNNYAVMTVDGLGVYFFNGILFYGVNQYLQDERTNLSSLLTNITINIDANNASIANLLTKINVNLNANDSSITNLIDEIKSTTNLVNSNVTRMLTQLETNFTFMYDLINSNNISFNNKLVFLNDTIKTLNLNQTAYFDITHDIVSSINLTESQRYQMEADAGTFAYHFVPKNETTNKTGIFVTSWLENAADKPVDNKTLVYEVWKNLTVAYVNLTDNKVITPYLISYNSYSITVFLPLNKTQLLNLQNGNGKAELSMYAPFLLDSVSNIATGNINPTNAVFLNTNVVVPWYVGLIANYYPPYSSNPITEIGNIIIWILDNAGGRALTLIVGLATLAYFAWMINRSRKSKGEKKWRYRVEKKLDLVYRKITGES